MRQPFCCLFMGRFTPRLLVYRPTLYSSFRFLHYPSCYENKTYRRRQQSIGVSFFSSMFVARRFVLVETNETPNPDCLRFFSMDLSFLKPGASMDLPNAGHAYKSPLAEMLFSIDGVEAIYLADEYVSVRKNSMVDWDDITPVVKEAIVQFSESKMDILSEEGEKAIGGENDDTEPEDDDDEVVLAVKELLATRIRPMLQADGGNLRYLDMDDGTVFVKLEGACKSCPSSGMTLKNGIERMLMHWVPEVVEVQECTDEMAEDILGEKALRKIRRGDEGTGKAEQ